MTPSSGAAPPLAPVVLILDGDPERSRLLAEALPAGLLLVAGKDETAEALIARVRDRAAQLGEASQHALEEARAALASFARSVAHDLRAPLRSIDGFSQALAEEYLASLDATGQKYLRFVRESAQQMTRLFDGLVALVRVAQSELRVRPVDLSAQFRAVAAELEASGPERQVDWVVEDGLIAQGDPQLLRMLIVELVGNAWKFSAPRPRARIELGREADRPVYFVRDNGVGFDMAQVGRLFGVFQRLHPVAEFRGSGVGLAIVQRIVQRHNGRIWAEGKVDGGATFFFSIGEGSVQS